MHIWLEKEKCLKYTGYLILVVLQQISEMALLFGKIQCLTEG